MGFKKASAKTVRVGEYEKLNDALIYVWFWQQRERNVPVSGALLQEKAKNIIPKTLS